jgi:AcrR family transcriptional regulator
MAGYSNKGAVGFGKVGRPANDSTRERLRIYRAAGPLILRNGYRRTTLREVARVAWLSPGGIYHYFDSKRQLVLFGLSPEALSTACTDAAAELRDALASRPPPPIEELIELFVEKNVRMIEFVRPALHSAIELGRTELQCRLSAGIMEDADSLVSALRGLFPDMPMAEPSADAIRRTIFGLALDLNVTPARVRRQLQWLFRYLLSPPVSGSVSIGRPLERSSPGLR